MDPFFHTGLSISDSLKTVRKSVLIYETIINESKEMVESILENKEFIKSAKVKVSDDDEKGTEIIDLFEEIYHDYIPFTLQSKKPLEYQEAFAAMRYYYKKSRDVLYKAVKYNS